ncbi:hypothetical protein [Paenibacillus senegalensis]|uniref:hypothetical protein n=1 Tax=Paenibacillus senegalensis TaxID=1465766 RepID=UPI0003124DED|nr:hypothetical protein [Paenibacillus senegalensis]
MWVHLYRLERIETPVSRLTNYKRLLLQDWSHVPSTKTILTITVRKIQYLSKKLAIQKRPG